MPDNQQVLNNYSKQHKTLQNYCKRVDTNKRQFKKKEYKCSKKISKKILFPVTTVIAKQRLLNVVHFLKFLSESVPVISICLLQMCHNKLTLKPKITVSRLLCDGCNCEKVHTPKIATVSVCVKLKLCLELTKKVNMKNCNHIITNF